MSLKKRDVYFIAGIVCLAVVLALGSLRGNGQNTPFDELHWPSYRAVKNGKAQAEVERACMECHTKKSLSYTKKHPPKEQCLICHKLIKEQ
jgi:hypothetical protein